MPITESRYRSKTDNEKSSSGKDKDPVELEKHKRERKIIRDQCRDQLMQCAKNKESALTEHDVSIYMSALEEENLRGSSIRTEEDKTSILRDFSKTYVQKTIKLAEQSGRKALEYIAQAEGKWITREHAEKKRKELKEGSFEKKIDFINTKMKAWQQLYKDLYTVRERQKQLHLSDDQLPELKALTDFKGKKFGEKRHLVDQALAALGATGNSAKSGVKKLLYEQAKNRLQREVENNVVSQKKMNELLRNVFEGNHEVSAIQRFLRGEGPQPLAELIAGWYKHRQRFDDLKKKKEEKKYSPHYFHLIDWREFKERYSYAQQDAYLEEQAHRLNEAPAEQAKAISYLKMRIRYNMEIQDWTSAQELIDEGLKEKPEDPEFLSMAKNAQLFGGTQNNQKDAAETENPAAIQREIWQMLGEVPSPIDALYEEAMLQCNLHFNPEIFERAGQIVFNRWWCYTRGYLNPHKERREYENDTNKELTRDYRDHGHTNRLEHVILNGDTADANSVGGKCHKPRVWYVDDQNKGEAVQSVVEQLCENSSQKEEGLGYWGTFVPIDVTIEKQRHVALNVNYRLKAALKRLYACKVPYVKRSQHMSVISSAGGDGASLMSPASVGRNRH